MIQRPNEILTHSSKFHKTMGSIVYYVIKYQEITVFDSTGLAIQDVVIASLIYRKAKRLGLGKRIKF